jgi:hypothetical protein
MSISEDAAVAAATYIMDHLHGLPADRGRCEWFFFEVVQAAVETAVKEDRSQRVWLRAQPSNN